MDAARVSENELIEALSRGRWARFWAHLLVFTSGILSLVAPSDVLMTQGSTALSMVTGSVWIIASGSCVIGTVLDHWMEEFIFIPVLVAALWVFSGALFAQAHETGLRVVPYGLFFLSFASWLLYRHAHVRGLLKAQRYAEEEE